MQPSNQEPSAKQSIIAIASFITLIITIIITFVIFSSLPKQQSIIEPISTSTDSILKQFNFTTMGRTLQDFIATNYELSSEALSNLKAIIRESTIEYTTNSKGKIDSIKFITDINQPKLTFIVNDKIDTEEEIIISCPPIELVQDPSTFCIGSNKKNTIDINLSQYLPYQGTTKNGIKYYLRQESDTIDSPKLIAYTSICNKETNTEEVQSDIDFWLIQHGIPNLDIIPIVIKDSGCNQIQSQ